jgi:putative MATE family efflux protein
MPSEAADAAAQKTTPAAPAVIDESNLFRSVVRLAWPVVIQQVSFSMVHLVDTALVGRLGEDELAGVRVAGQIFWFGLSGMTAVAVGATAIVAREVGAGKTEGASRTLRNAIVMSIIWGVLIGIGMWFLGSWALGMLGAEPGARDQGALYLKAIAFGMPLFSMIYAGSACLQGSGDTRTPMLVGVTVNVVNAIAAYLLIFGPGPFPRLEVVGSGLSFTLAAAVGVLLIVVVLVQPSRSMRWTPLDVAKFDPREAKRILNIGVPAGLEQVQFSIAFMVYTRIIATLGTTALAAHGVTLAIQSLTFNVGFALSVATTALVGQSLGAQRPDLAERSAYVAMRYSVLFTLGLAAVLMIFGEEITSIFVGGPDADDIIDIGGTLLFVFAFAMPGLAVSLALGGGLRGAGDTRAVLFIMAGSTWIVRLVPAYLFAIVLGLGVPGAWLAAVLDINMRAFLMWLRFHQGRWKKIKV